MPSNQTSRHPLQKNTKLIDSSIFIFLYFIFLYSFILILILFSLFFSFCSSSSVYSSCSSSSSSSSSSVPLYVNRDRADYYRGLEPRTSTSTFTQLLSSASYKTCGQVQCCFTSTETYGLLGTKSPGRPPRLPYKTCGQVQCCFTSTETVRTFRDRETRTSTSTFTQLLSSAARM